MKVLVIIPAYNEAANIENVVENLTGKYPQYDYIIVNDGSRDETAKICEKNGYKFLDLPVNLGLSGAFQTGLRYAYNNGYDAAVQYDADGQHRAEYIEKMVQEIEKGSDIVIGSRFVSEKKPKTLRMFGSYLISWAITLTTGKRICDPTSGMRMFNRRLIEEFALDANYEPEPDTLSYLIKNGAKVKEIQVVMDERTAGESYLNLSRSVRYMFKIGMSIVVIQWFRKRNKAD